MSTYWGEFQDIYHITYPILEIQVLTMQIKIRMDKSTKMSLFIQVFGSNGSVQKRAPVDSTKSMIKCSFFPITWSQLPDPSSIYMKGIQVHGRLLQRLKYLDPNCKIGHNQIWYEVSYRCFYMLKFVSIDSLAEKL